MMHLRLLTLLALLTAAAAGAWADDTFSTSPYETDQQFNNRVTVAANTTLTINKGVTVTAKAGLNIQSGATLTVTGGGTLEIHNRDGADGINAFDDEEFPISSSSGDPGSDAIEGGGTLAIDDATVIAIGSNGGKGGKAHGRRQASDGGDGGYGVSGVIVTIISGSITVLGGSGGEGGAGSSYCAAGSAGADSKGFKTFPTIPGATICWSDNGSDWTPYENNTGDTKRYMKSYYYPPTYSVKMKDGTKDAANWTISTGSGDNVRTATGSDADGLMGLYKGDAVTLKYNGRLKVKSVTATTDANPLTVPLTMEVIEAGSIKVDMEDGLNTMLTTGMKYSVNGGEKQTIYLTTTIENLRVGDKVQFYGNEENTKAYGNYTEVKISGGTAKVKVYGNIMSLLNENNFTNLTTLPNKRKVFCGLFYGNAKLTDASGLLLPAKTLAEACYFNMFYGCTSLTAAPALPAETLTINCYVNMFYGCKELTDAPTLPAPTLVRTCYESMFADCSKLASVTCLARDISAFDCLYNWLDGTYGSIARTLYVDDSMKDMSSSVWNINDNWTIKPVSEKP